MYNGVHKEGRVEGKVSDILPAFQNESFIPITTFTYSSVVHFQKNKKYSIPSTQNILTPTFHSTNSSNSIYIDR